MDNLFVGMEHAKALNRPANIFTQDEKYMVCIPDIVKIYNAPGFHRIFICHQIFLHNKQKL